MEIYERDIALEWYRYGNEKKDDFFIRFMMYWIGFNWLYSQMEYDENGNKFPNEREKVIAYYKKHKRKFERIDYFLLPGIEVLLNHPVNGKKGLQQRLKEGNTDALLLTLYQVRCNLFHGSKSLHNERDIALVKASANILGEYMKVLVADPLQSTGNAPYNPR